MDEEEKEIFKVKYSDSKSFVKKLKEFVDSKVKVEIQSHLQVVSKARTFLDEKYDFSGKTRQQIMRDAIKTQRPEQFKDSELDIAFKLLQKNTSNSTVNIEREDEISKLKNQEY